jgi:glucuronate isomerase
MTRPLQLHPDRLFPPDPRTRDLARALYRQVAHLPIISPHGHTDPAWFASNSAWSNATEFLLAGDHYLYRMLYSQGVPLTQLGVPQHGVVPTTPPRDAWRTFASRQHLFRGTPSRLWLDHVFAEVFGFDVALSADTADHYFDRIGELLAGASYRPRALFERFNIEFLATTEGAHESLEHHVAIRTSGWKGRVVSTYRPDAVVDPEHPEFRSALAQFASLTGEDIGSWQGYLRAHCKRRADFKAIGATASDHGHPSAATADLGRSDAEALFSRVMHGSPSVADAELFRAQMLTEMARMSLDDGLVMQIHAGSHRNHNTQLLISHGRDKGADIPSRTDFVGGLKPLLNAVGNETGLTIILFTLDESAYARELAPLAGHYPCLRLGPPWWFHDSPEGMLRFREMTTETAGFYNGVGFNDDTRAFLSIPARHDVARRVDCAYLARLVAEHRLGEDDAAEVAVDLTCNLVRQAYRI